MGNRAVLEFTGSKLGIYLHWNGGKNSVEAFLICARLFGLRGEDTSYGIARLAQIIGNYLGGTLSLGIGDIAHLDTNNMDNGVYLINSEFQIIGRKHFNGIEQSEPPMPKLLAEVYMANKDFFTVVAHEDLVDKLIEHLVADDIKQLELKETLKAFNAKPKS